MYAQIFVCKRNLTEHFPFFNRLVRFLTLTAQFISNESASLLQTEHTFLFGLKKRTKIKVSFCDGRDEYLTQKAESLQRREK